MNLPSLSGRHRDQLVHKSRALQFGVWSSSPKEGSFDGVLKGTRIRIR